MDITHPNSHFPFTRLPLYVIISFQAECQVSILIDLLLFCEPQLETEATGNIVRVMFHSRQPILYLISFCATQKSEKGFIVFNIS